MTCRLSIGVDVEGRAVATKVGTAPADDDRLQHEATMLAAAQGRGVVELVGCTTNDDGRVELATAVAGSHTLDTLGVRPLATTVDLLAALAHTVADLHDRHLVHRRIDPTHVVVGVGGQPVLCGFAEAGRVDRNGGGRQTATADDVHALGTLVHTLLAAGDDDDVEPIPDRRWAVWRRPAWSGYERRSLLTLADQATADDPLRRPPARRLAAQLTAAREQLSEAVDVRPSSGRQRRTATSPTPAPAAQPADVAPARPGLRTIAPKRDSRDRPRPSTPSRPRRERAAGASSPVATEPRWPRLAALAGAAVGLAVVAGGIAALRPTPDARPVVERADPSASTTPRAPTSPPPPASASAASPSTTARCAGPVGPMAPDRDGDGCPEPITVPAPGIVQLGTDRFSVGEPGDRIVVDDWDCDGQPTAAVLRPSSGEVFVFSRWATAAAELEIAPIALVDDAVDLVSRRPPDSACPRPTAVLGDGSTREVAP